MRNSDRGAPVAAAFPKVHLVYGTLEDAKILEEEAAKADVVLRMFFFFFCCFILGYLFLFCHI